ncbi:LPS biosynthesis protein WbpP [bacterium DOLJORAL78_65_58]|nr:MAG: LPS biosynthesis protein WbpP [bacterium DOLZORAL124_64_63]PIE76156.1 MAG: LPS biosynthesis protein WbpP [bacterium DOLJORAL78_65_58]
MAKYLVTGGAGFIGSHLARELVQEGHETIVLDNLSTGRIENIADIQADIRFVEGSITDLDTVLDCCQGVDCVFHQAALPSVPRSVKDPLTSDEHNIGGTLRVFWGAHQSGVRRVVYAASSSIYGNTAELPKHEGMQPNPMSPYAVNKRVSELYGAVFNNLYGLSTIGLRYFNVFGPRQDPNSQYAAVVPKFITRFLDGLPPTIHGDGLQSRDFTYIANVVEANLAAAKARDEAGGRSYNVALGGRITVKDLCLKIRDLVGCTIEPVHEETRAGDVRHSQADVSAAREMLDYQGSVDLDEGLRRTVDWYRKSHKGVKG